LIAGLPDYQVADLKKNTLYQGYTENSQQIKWFWEYMEGINSEEKMNFLQYVTGSSKVPVEGFELL
jgi:E3 ubiquitin-protein ligase HUWE1